MGPETHACLATAMLSFTFVTAMGIFAKWISICTYTLACTFTCVHILLALSTVTKHKHVRLSLIVCSFASLAQGGCSALRPTCSDLCADLLMASSKFAVNVSRYKMENE